MARASFSNRRIIGGRDAADRVLQGSVLRIALRATIVSLGVLAASISSHAQTATIERFQPILSVCVLPPSPTPVAPWPVAATDSLDPTAGAPVTFARAALLANDTGELLTILRVAPSSTAGGTITGTDPLTYTPPALFRGNDTFAYEISDSFGQTTVGIVTVRVIRDTVAPTVSVTAPSAGTVSGTVIISASASDNVAVISVRFFDGATRIGAEVTTPPYQVAWDTRLVVDGPHNLTAVARDAAGNRRTSAIVTVNVANAVTGGGPAVDTLAASVVRGHARPLGDERP